MRDRSARSGNDAVSAVDTTTDGQNAYGNTCSCTSEQIQASDGSGLHTVDRATQPEVSQSALKNLTLTGDTLT